MNDCIVAFDVGTQSIRAALIDVCGNVVDIVKTPIEPYFSAHPGWAEQQPTYYWDKLCETSKRLAQREPFKKAAIKAATITTQRGTYVNVDKAGQPLRPAIVWLDQRRADPQDWAPAVARMALKAAGMFGSLDNHYRRCYANWIRQHQPQIWEQTHKFLLLSGFLTYKLSGRFVESLGCNCGYLPIDHATQLWAGKRSVVRRLFPVEDAKLPELVAQGEVAGQITAAAAEATGLAQGLPLMAAANDKACEILGSGSITPDIGCISYGTTATINAVSDKFVELFANFPPMPSAVPGYYYTEMSVLRGFWMVSWFKEEFGLKEELLAKERGVAPESLFDDMIRAVPPGCDGLVLQPYWSPFWTYCGDEGRGSVVGFTDVHSRAHVYRAILEGIVYALKDGAELTEMKMKVAFKSLRVSGGGSQSAAAMQITADVFGLPAERPHTFETSAVGAAIDAAVGLGYYPDFPSAIKGMTRIKDCFEPIASNQSLYHDLHQRVYRKLYARLEPIFREIKSVMDEHEGRERPQ